MNSNESLVDYYRNKTILVTGATGFVGKAVLWHLLKTAGQVIDKVYVLIRPKRIPGGTPSQRLLDEIINTKVFKELMNKGLFKREKLIPISYDLTLSQLGLSMEESVQMKDINIVVHCASTSEYESSLEWNLETNVLGTIRLMDYLNNECLDMCSFVYMSPIHIYQDLPSEEGPLIKEQVYDLAGLGDPNEFLQSLLGADEKELPNFMKRILQKYPTLHLFTKALVEHLITKKHQVFYSSTIFRSGYIGPSAMEPTPGWTSGVSGMSAWLALYGQSIPVIQPDQGQRPLRITPIDYVSQSIIHAIPQLNHKGSSLIYHIPSLPLPLTWYQAYTAIQDYWSRPVNSILHDQKLPTAASYFSTNKALSKAKFLMRYYFRPNKTNVTKKSPLDIDQSKWLELASNTRNNLAKQYLHPWEYDTSRFDALLSKTGIEWIEPYDRLDLYSYLMQSCFGVKIYTLHAGPQTRTSVLDSTCDCALYSVIKSKAMENNQPSYPSLINEPFQSIVYTEEEMRQRVQHMMDITMTSLHHPKQSLEDEKVWKPVWIEYINDTLEDWCTIIESQSHNEKRWKLDENAELAKVTVLNDAKVIEAIHQVSERSGMPAEKVMDEAVKSLNRIQERTQLSYAWFAASYLEKLFKTMFSCIRINKVDLVKIQHCVQNKQKVVYVPVNRTVLDPILVWFLAIRYDLPIPALVLDEALAILGPISDILRLAGAVFIKRDPSARSVLTTGVTSAYLRHLLRERGALTMVLEKVRSRSGLLQRPYNDGLLEMIQQEKDVVFVPVNLTYEEIPDLDHLVKQDLQHLKSTKSTTISGLNRTKSQRMSTPTKLSRPSDSRAQRVRSRSLGHGQLHLLKQDEEHESSSNKKNHIGKVLVGFGEPVYLKSDSENQDIASEIQREQKKAVVLSPVSLIAAILLFSRVQGNMIDLETMKEYLKYLYNFVKVQGISVDWQESESVLNLAYYANQLQEIFILDSIFAVVYLSLNTLNDDNSSVFLERFEFLATLFQPYISMSWDIKKEYDRLLDKYKENYDMQQFSLLASFIYPTIDSFWVTLCALSALVDDVKALPYSLIPILTQWIGMHLISGRRTIYSEVLSAEYSQNAIKSFFQFDLLSTEPAKMILSPDAQMLMQALGLPTNEDLVVKQEKHNIRDVCRKIEQVRIKQEEGPSSTYVFEKCQNQIKSLIRTKDNNYFSKKMGATVIDPKEEAMIQLGYTLIQSMVSK
ncbi:hypothetical protein G6F46_007502 [Rhizopus delemar]|uniref:Fatty acyl-CoA reductase n=2 Tax=Rhizopus TaxID=4842 RepID=A0A9P7CL62_9FUNG|nr:hypothetical protein G6F55_009815 [Rhizopus delemar]KAG1538454.1 hypothetical protein G6F51_009761 [Rhizopus arrhizus]KAG1494403.1 hypothetical protein G6F54_007898 [Rhizopus delemar]KAG1506700.1 hypothetical protein G6F53_009500 [Rhizopus delemar]KAG1520417.1 hypothetical protein G6F52_007685 [Rhizopus delemar]